MIAEDIIQALRTKAAENAPVQGKENSWEAYAAVLEYFNEAARHVPPVAVIAATDIGDIDRLFIEELERLADLVVKLFPRGGLTEFAIYMRNSSNSGLRRSWL